ncbi:23S rRNA (guanosine(2251)-2'-O)-methyltransferase RlmB [Fulvivirga sediminis]|uniref:23S rRNA (Guanosine(2251)-2'-O)-methyltransferase RlmB n=1 Tax=Fulvivirga sediminis TaxID=2803949 RepID=A0A937F4Y3_9BACT|nr:23S rRNA (guanosine(2251)-2'-O)-methyltransferase RlmB [Fulvivirga sediminis]MBL3654967.1 23S rRNA (guanosine(2251)-2'-O)-methyltransferase RlmB [Fulvivirga sediminis]
MADNKEYIFGTRAVLESINSGKEIDKLLVQKGLFNDLTKELMKEARAHNIPISQVPLEKLNRVTRKNHQGAIAFLSAVNYASLDNVINEVYQKGKEPFFIILDRVTDVRNFGAIARTAECSGVDAIIVPSKGSAAINNDAMKTSAGALNYIPVCREDNLKTTIKYLQESGIQIVACTEKTDSYIYDIDFKQPVAILLGSEENGISPEYLKMCNYRGKIPMAGNIASLNVSVSAAIAIYEAIRQKGAESL